MMLRSWLKRSSIVAGVAVLGSLVTVSPATARQPRTGWTWSARFPEEGSDTAKARLNAIVVDSADNAIVAGSALGALRLEGGPDLPADDNEHAFIAKISPRGRLLWARRVGGIQGGSELAEHGATAMIVDEHDVVTAIGEIDPGGNDGAVDPSPAPGHRRRIVRFETDGRTLDVKVLDQHADVLAVTRAPGLDLYVAGCLRSWVGGFPPTQQQQGAFVGRITRSGKWIWSHAVRDQDSELPLQRKSIGNAADCATALAPAAEGGLFVVGPFVRPFRMGADRLDLDDGSFLARFSSNGSLVWARPVPQTSSGPRVERPSLALTREGGVVVPGLAPRTTSDATLVTGVIAFAPDGARRWARSIYSDSECCQPSDLLLAAANGHILVAGFARGKELRIEDRVVTDLTQAGAFVLDLPAGRDQPRARTLSNLADEPTVVAAGKRGIWVGGIQRSVGGGAGIYLQWVSRH